MRLYANVLLCQIDGALQKLTTELNSVKTLANLTIEETRKLAKDFSKHIVEKDFFFASEWAIYATKLSDYLPSDDIQVIYKVSSYLADINDVIKTGDWEKVYDIYPSHIRVLIDRNDCMTFSMSNMCKRAIRVLEELV